jgi:sulfoxide reductase catalytic subunit YedY
MPKLAERAPLAAPRNARYDPGRAITPEPEATSYNNYYEFGQSKSDRTTRPRR